MQDFNYLSSNDFELTLELGCEKYPPAKLLRNEWERNKDALINFMWQVCIKQIHRFINFKSIIFFQAHIGIKGIVYDSTTKLGISNAIIHVQNMTAGRIHDIQHDITSGTNKK